MRKRALIQIILVIKNHKTKQGKEVTIYGKALITILKKWWYVWTMTNMMLWLYKPWFHGNPVPANCEEGSLVMEEENKI